MANLNSNAFTRAFCLCLFTSAIGHAAEEATVTPAKKLEVLVIAGGHNYKTKPFQAIFDNYKDMLCTFVVEKTGGEAFDDIDHWPYDAIVLYDYVKKPSDKQWDNFLKLLDRGVGLTILHHAFKGYQIRPEFQKIVGFATTFNGTQEGVEMAIHVADADHPITQGLKDFIIDDELYKSYKIEPAMHALLTTETGLNGKVLSWVHTYRKSPVCYLQLGHGPSAYSNPTFVEYLGRAIRWTTGRPTVNKESAAVVQAVAVAEAWLALVDDVKYGEGYETSADYLKNVVGKDEFVKSLNAARKPLGKLISREVKSTNYLTSLPGAPDGEYVVIQFKTSLENKKSTIETITPMLGKDGKWRVSGYFIK